MGDVNMDGVVDKADADLVLEYVAETKQLTPGQLRLADMGGSGRVTAYDAARILQKAGAGTVGLDNYLRMTEQTAPSTASAGTVRIYAKTDGLLYWKDDAGTERAINYT